MQRDGEANTSLTMMNEATAAKQALLPTTTMALNEETLPIIATAGSATAEATPQSSSHQSNMRRRWSFFHPLGRCSLQSLLLVVVAILLATDVYMRTRPLTSAAPRWVPVRDILNATATEEELKFTRDVGDYPLQGLALSHDQDTLYQVHTMAIRVLSIVDDDTITSKQSRVWTEDEFPLLQNNLTVRHIGGVDLVDDVNLNGISGPEVWMATHSDGIDGVGALVAVDPATLDIKKERRVLTDVNLDWVAYQDGILYYGVFFNVKRVKRVRADSTLEPLPDLELVLPDELAEGGVNYVQSAAFDLDGRLVLLGDDYQCTCYWINIDTGELVKKQGLLLGSETDGITFDRKRQRMLVGFNRQHSHEQVMGVEDMASIIELKWQ